MIAADPRPELPPAFERLTLLRLEVELRALGEVKVAGFLGSTLRGALGWALKESACTVPPGDCPRCLVALCCPYTAIFEPQSRLPDGTSPNRPSAVPYVIQAPEIPAAPLHRGQPVRFRLILYGSAARWAPRVVLALPRMASRGLGRDPGPLALTGVWRIAPDETLLSLSSSPHGVPLDFGPSEHLADYVGKLPTEPIALQVELLSTLRLKSDGVLHRDFSWPRFVRTLTRRAATLASLWEEFPFPAEPSAILSEADSTQVVEQALRWQTGRRFSNRQETSLPVDGFMGHLKLGSVSPALVGVLRAGELLHVGHGTAYGHGRYRVLSA